MLKWTPTVGRGHQAGVTPNLLIAHLEKIPPTQVLLCEPSPPLASVNNQLMLKKLKCAVCSNILSQPLELQCGTLVCAKCLQEWIAASGAVNCLLLLYDCRTGRHNWHKGFISVNEIWLMIGGVKHSK